MKTNFQYGSLTLYRDMEYRVDCIILNSILRLNISYCSILTNSSTIYSQSLKLVIKMLIFQNDQV